MLPKKRKKRERKEERKGARKSKEGLPPSSNSSPPLLLPLPLLPSSHILFKSPLEVSESVRRRRKGEENRGGGPSLPFCSVYGYASFFPLWNGIRRVLHLQFQGGQKASQFKPGTTNSAPHAAAFFSSSIQCTSPAVWHTDTQHSLYVYTASSLQRRRQRRQDLSQP